MKTLVLFILSVYQKIVSPLFHQLLGQKTMCRHETSCSEYAKDAITEHGVIKGSVLSVQRFLSCSPFIKLYATNN